MQRLGVNSYKLILSLFALLLCQMALAADKRVNLAVDLATPVMEAEKGQTAFIKIALTGFEMDQTEQTRVPANIAVVLDKSGSMQGDKIDQAKKAAIMAIQRLEAQDIVSVITYDSTVNVIVPATKVTDKAQIAQSIRNIRADGNTALFAGVSKGASEVRKFIEANRVNRVILLSDGLANVGPSSATELAELGRSLGKEGISVTTIGLGLGYNEDLMTQLAGYSDGNHAFVERAEDLARIFQYEFGDVMSVVAKEVDIHIECADDIKPVRILGRDADIQGNSLRTTLNQLYSKQEKYLILEVEVPPQKAGVAKELVKVDVSYHNLSDKKQDKLAAAGKVSFTKSEREIKANVNTKAYADAVEQVVNERSKEAVKLRDKGDVMGAQQVLKSSAAFIEESASIAPSPKLEEQRQEVLKDADDLDEADWNKTRKSLKEKQYKRATQQNY
ncbi:MAG: VWA domain-containing protein [Hahellaceae bacterium]|nr:VWA domain-containing protein [Hahellaceae bacterium]MCP5169006.1 VWA domain-containing protein [Hahellaceae bacterium]